MIIFICTSTTGFIVCMCVCFFHIHLYVCNILFYIHIRLICIGAIITICNGRVIYWGFIYLVNALRRINECDYRHAKFVPPNVISMQNGRSDNKNVDRNVEHAQKNHRLHNIYAYK